MVVGVKEVDQLSLFRPIKNQHELGQLGFRVLDSSTRIVLVFVRRQEARTSVLVPGKQGVIHSVAIGRRSASKKVHVGVPLFGPRARRFRQRDVSGTGDTRDAKRDSPSEPKV